MVTWILVLLLQTTPYPVFAFLKEDFESEDACMDAGKKVITKMEKDIDDIEDRLGCMPTFPTTPTSI